jgi:Ca2+/H+ antiporter
VSIAVSLIAHVTFFVSSSFVFSSLITGYPINLVLTIFEIVTVAVSVALVASVVIGVESDWTKALMPFRVYTILAIAFYSPPL